MNGSFIHFIHLMAFGMVVATLLPSFLLDRKLRAESDWRKKLQIGGLMRMLGAMAPWTVLLLLVTGIGNMFNRFLGAPYPWYEETWLIIKIALVLIIAFNALFVVPRIGMKRAGIIKSLLRIRPPRRPKRIMPH